jgi:GntR family transcriptional regulator
MQPLHARVADELRARIAQGDLAPGTPLPSEAQLCVEFGASRGTVRTALANLRLEGLISGTQRRRPVVREGALSQPFDTLVSFTLWAKHIGSEPGQRTIEIARRQASPAAAQALGLEPGEPVIDVLRLRLLDGEPVLLERDSFIEPVGRLLFNFDPDTASIYGHLMDSGVDIHGARRTLSAVGADTTAAALLGVEVGAPLLREIRLATTADGVPFEYGDDQYRSELVNFTIAHSRTAATGISRDRHLPHKSE